MVNLIWEYLEFGIEIDDNELNDKGKYEIIFRIVKLDINKVIKDRIDFIYWVFFNYKGCLVYYFID